MRALIDRLVASWGYVPKPQSNAREAADDRGPPPPPAYLRHEALFDYAQASCSGHDWAFFRSTPDSLSWSVGKRGWMPVAFAGMLIGGGYTDALGLISTAIEDRMWLSASSPELSGWLAANTTAFERVQRLEVQEPWNAGEDRVAVFDADAFAGLPAVVVSHELRTMWRRCFPRQTVAILSPSQLHAQLSDLPLMRQAAERPSEALGQLVEWSGAWLSARGLNVDPKGSLAEVEGYLPLVYFDEEPGSF